MFDTRDAAKDVSGDPRTLALSLGSVQMLERLRAWPGAKAAPIRQVHVSQAPPTLATPFGEPVVHIRADELGVPMLGAVLSYGTLLAPLQQAFLDACATRDGALGTLDGRPARALRHRGRRRRDRRRRRRSSRPKAASASASISR